MKEKILAAIKAKFSKTSWSKKGLDTIVAILEKKADGDETKIDALIDDYSEFLTDYAKQEHKVANLEDKIKKSAPPKEDGDPKQDPEPPKDDDTPGWAKALIESNKTLSEKLAAIEGEKVQTTMKSKAEALLKDVPKSYWSEWAIPQKDDEMEAFVTKVQTGYESFTKDLSDKGFATLPIPGGANHKPLSKEASQEAINNVVDKIMT